MSSESKVIFANFPKARNQDSGQAGRGASDLAISKQGSLISESKAAVICGLEAAQLRRWRQMGLLSSLHSDGYSFDQLVIIRALGALKEAGLSSRFVARAMHTMHRFASDTPVDFLKQLGTAGQTLMASDSEGVFDPLTGQCAFPFVQKELDRFHHVEKKHASMGHRNALARRFFLRALRAKEQGRALSYALRCLAQAKRYHPDSIAVDVETASVYEAMGKYRKAETLLHKVFEKQPLHTEARLSAARLALHQDDWSSAEKHLQISVKIDPGHAKAHLMLSVVLELMNRSDDAELHWRAYLELEPTSLWSDLAFCTVRKTKK
ncbi:MAG: tetratricopeptide repeat protein [Myxococcales bacterium]|nr:MAG: tetratricopeptide repeat protein [Myxococcales bacterium]